jgi:uncharacterized protein HemX
MGSAPLQIAAASVAVAWPLAAGLTLVLWTKARAAERRRRLAAIEGGLKGLFHAVERQPLSERLELVVDALDEQAAMAAQAKAAAPRRRRKAAPTN